PRPYSQRPPRNEYVLTAKGKDLYGVLVTLHAWGEKHVYGDEPSGIVLRHKTCGHDLKPRIACGCCNEMVRPREVEVVFTENRPTVGEVMPAKDEAAIAAVSALVVIALLVLVAALADASRQTRESFRWVTHSAKVIQAMEETVAGLRDAESGQRAYVLTRNPAYAQSFDTRVSDSLRAFGELVELTRDNPSQQLRLQALGAQLSGRIELMRQPLTLARSGDFARAEALIAEGRGFDSMSAFVLAARELLDEERVVQARRVEAAERRLARVRGLALIGGPLIAFFSLSVSFMVIRGIRQPVRVITRAMTGLGAGDLNQRIDSRMGSREFDRLARGYNDMADRLATAAKDQSRSERELKRVHEELLASAQTLR
ncbi:hypothetical protein LTR94_027253, partial [Friedmanniomyces endolithicus]